MLPCACDGAGHGACPLATCLAHQFHTVTVVVCAATTLPPCFSATTAPHSVRFRLPCTTQPRTGVEEKDLEEWLATHEELEREVAEAQREHDDHHVSKQDLTEQRQQVSAGS